MDRQLARLTVSRVICVAGKGLINTGKQISDTGKRLTDKLAGALSRQGTSEEPLPPLPERVDADELIAASRQQEAGSTQDKPASKAAHKQGPGGYTTVGSVQIPKLALPRQAAAARAAENKAAKHSQPAEGASKAQPLAKPAAPLDRARGASPVKNSSSPLRGRSPSPARRGKSPQKGKGKGKGKNASPPPRPRRQLSEAKPFNVPSASDLQQAWRMREKETAAQSRSIWQADQDKKAKTRVKDVWGPLTDSSRGKKAPARGEEWETLSDPDEWGTLQDSSRAKQPALGAAAEWDVLTQR